VAVNDPVDEHEGPRWDLAALKAGGSVCIVFAVPFQILALVLGSGSGVSLLLRVLALVGFLLGAGVAAWSQQLRLPLAHGMVTALASFVIVQVGFIVARAIVGHDLRLGAAVLNLAPVLGVGLLGGYLGMALQRRGLLPSTVRTDRDGGSAS
jgi:hypothetical protein